MSEHKTPEAPAGGQNPSPTEGDPELGEAFWQGIERSLAGVIDRAEAGVQIRRLDLGGLDAKLNELAGSSSEATKKALGHLTDRRNGLAQDIDALEAQVADFRRLSESVSSLRGQMDKLARSREDLRKEDDALRAQAEASRQELARLQTEVDELSKGAEQISRLNEDLKRETLELRKGREQLEAERALLRAELEAVNAERGELERVVELLTDSGSALATPPAPAPPAAPPPSFEAPSTDPGDDAPSAQPDDESLPSSSSAAGGLPLPAADSAPVPAAVPEAAPLPLAGNAGPQPDDDEGEAWTAHQPAAAGQTPVLAEENAPAPAGSKTPAPAPVPDAAEPAPAATGEPPAASWGDQLDVDVEASAEAPRLPPPPDGEDVPAPPSEIDLDSVDLDVDMEVDLDEEIDEMEAAAEPLPASLVISDDTRVRHTSKLTSHQPTDAADVKLAGILLHEAYRVEDIVRLSRLDRDIVDSRLRKFAADGMVEFENSEP